MYEGMKFLEERNVWRNEVSGGKGMTNRAMHTEEGRKEGGLQKSLIGKFKQKCTYSSQFPLKPLGGC